MALNKLEFEPPFQTAFPKGLFLLGEVQPVTEFQKERNAPVIQKVDFDRDGNGTGKRLWKGTVADPDAPNAKQASYEVIFVADVKPVPAAAEIVPGMTPIELVGMTLKPTVSGSGEYKSLGWRIRATGIKGDNSGTVAPGDHSASAPRDRKAAA